MLQFVMLPFTVSRRTWLSAPTLWVTATVAWFGLAGVGAGDEPPRETGNESREKLDRFVKGYQLFHGADRVPLEMQAEPVLRWPNSTRDTQEGATFVWTRNGRPEAIACVWENGGLWAHAFHSLSDSRLVARHKTQTFWQTEKPGLEFNRFPDAPEPADSAVQRLAQMKDLARRFKCRLADVNRKSEELRLLPRPLYRYKTERKDLGDGALFAFVQGTDPEVVLVLEAARHDGKSEWRYALTRRTGYAVEADLDGKPNWSVPGSNGGTGAPWFVGTLGSLN
ncbi:MAG TPA: hypothetical protein VGM05_27890 [Planctomycetaceae bacterium]